METITWHQQATLGFGLTPLEGVLVRYLIADIHISRKVANPTRSWLRLAVAIIFRW